MSQRPAPEALLPWARAELGVPQDIETSEFAVVAGDASSRRYFRMVIAGQSYMLAEAPPATEKNEAFLAVRGLLARAGLTVPEVYAADLQRGFLLLEDLGDDLMLGALNETSADAYYRSAFDVLVRLAAIDCHTAGIAAYDRALLEEELSRFQQWFVVGLLEHEADGAEQALMGRFFKVLIDSALEQPAVVVHRDFHSRNLMVGAVASLGVIDFQDAVVGPVTYDLASLLRDCYIQWPREQVSNWALDYRALLVASGQLTGVDEAQFLRWFDWMGLQRHIKVLGTFARLYLRDGKSAYLEDLPLVLSYVEEILEKYAPEEEVFREFKDWFANVLAPLVSQQDWSKSS